MKLKMHKRSVTITASCGEKLTLTGVSISDSPYAPIIHRGGWKDKGWCVSEPRSGVALMIGLPTRAEAIRFTLALRALLNKFAPKGRRAA